MNVCKHGCGVKLFCFSRANHASTNLKKFSSSKLDKFTKQELITRARLRGQDFASGKNFSFNHCHTKSFAFFLGKFIL